MKKIILTLAIAFFALNSFASDANVNQKVLDAFTAEFKTATEVSWTAEEDYFKATFNINGKYAFAFYTQEGEFLGLSRYVSPLDLPVILQNSLKNNYEGYWISDLFEVSKTNGTSYYITVENADNTIVLKSDNSSWRIHKKIKKS